MHTPTTDPANTSAFFSLKNAVVVYSGFAGTETSLDQRDWQANLTILSGDIDGNDVNTDGNFIAETPADIQGSNSIHVVWNSNVDPTAVLNGFIITAGKYVDVSLGAGIDNVNASPTLVHLTISGNSGYEGGGMENHLDSSPTVTQVTFTGNSAVSGGGGMKNYSNSNPLLTNVVSAATTPTTAAACSAMPAARCCATCCLRVTPPPMGAASTAMKAHRCCSTPPSAATAPSMPQRLPERRQPYDPQLILWGDTLGHPGDQSRQRPHHRGIQQHLRLRRIGRLGQRLRGDGGGNIDLDPLYRDFSGGNMRLQDSSPAMTPGTTPPCRMA